MHGSRFWWLVMALGATAACGGGAALHADALSALASSGAVVLVDAPDEIRRTHNLDVEVVRHPGNRNVGQWTDGQLALFPAPSGFVVLPKRWVVERTNAWNLRPRRLVQDHDRNLAVSTAWIWLAEARMLLRRLTASPAATA